MLRFYLQRIGKIRRRCKRVVGSISWCTRTIARGIKFSFQVESRKLVYRGLLLKGNNQDFIFFNSAENSLTEDE